MACAADSVLCYTVLRSRRAIHLLSLLPHIHVFTAFPQQRVGENGGRLDPGVNEAWGLQRPAGSGETTDLLGTQPVRGHHHTQPQQDPGQQRLCS